MDPAAFAAELISRLEKLQLELESRHSLEARLQQIREVALALALPRPRRAPGSLGSPRTPSAASTARMKRRRAPT